MKKWKSESSSFDYLRVWKGGEFVSGTRRVSGVFLYLHSAVRFPRVTRPYPDSTCTCARTKRTQQALPGAERPRMLGHASYLLVAPQIVASCQRNRCVCDGNVRRDL